MSYTDAYQYWLTAPEFDAETKAELETIKDNDKEIEDRFYRDLEFGTGGLRGVMGAGSNRMNRYTVGKATTGLANYLLKTKSNSEITVVIGYDTRNNSRYFAETAAAVFSANGIAVKILSSPRPTPQLSFSVKHLNADAGIVITASHNPKEYNGYKVYNKYGCQLCPGEADEVIKEVNAVTDYASIDFNKVDNLITEIDTTDEFVDAVLLQSRNHNDNQKANLKIVYTPLHGSGQVPVTEALKKDGFTEVTLLTKQADGNGDFPTVVSPNPEDKRALELGIKKAEDINADIVIGTDPDSDRVGIAVRNNDSYQLMTGNQVGALLMDYIIGSTDLTKVKNPAIVKTVVTSELGAEIARRSNINVFTTLTGFKYIGEKITQFEASGDYTFLFGYEESYGYLAGTHAEDKDAVVSSMLIAEMSAYYKSQNKTLVERINELYSEYGYYLDALDSYTLKGIDGQQRIKTIMKDLRTNGSPFKETNETIDYSKGIEDLPKSDVLKFILSDGSWIAARPSGTEPKIKFYYSIKDKDSNTASKKLEEIRETIVSECKLN